VTQSSPDYTLLEDGAEYALSSAASGDGYLLQNKADGVSADLQGEDAARFRHDYDELKIRYPAWSADQVLAQLWDQGGYGWLAT